MVTVAMINDSPVSFYEAESIYEVTLLIKRTPIQKLKTIRKSMKSDLSDHRYNTKYHTHIFKVLHTTNTICGEHFVSSWVQVSS